MIRKVGLIAIFCLIQWTTVECEQLWILEPCMYHKGDIITKPERTYIFIFMHMYLDFQLSSFISNPAPVVNYSLYFLDSRWYDWLPDETDVSPDRFWPFYLGTEVDFSVCLQSYIVFMETLNINCHLFLDKVHGPMVMQIRCWIGDSLSLAFELLYRPVQLW